MKTPLALKLGLLIPLSACATPVGLEPGADVVGGTGAQAGLGGKSSSGGTKAAGGSGGKASGGTGGLGGSSIGGSSAGGGSSGGSGGASAGGGAGGSTAAGGSGASGGGASGAGGSGGNGGSAPCTPPVPGGLCDTFSQCGCAPAQNCDVQGPTGFTSCGPSGPKSAYQTCSNPIECGKGTSCVSYACKPFCKVDSDCSQPSARCVQVYMGTPVPGWKSCTAGCDPMNPSSVCGAGATCALVLPDVTDCVGGAGTGIGPGTCWPGNEQACAPGYGCRSDGACAKWCRIGQNDCAPGSACTSTPLGVSVNGVAFGTCS